MLTLYSNLVGLTPSVSPPQRQLVNVVKTLYKNIAIQLHC